jgi:hypothetical protein
VTGATDPGGRLVSVLRTISEEADGPLRRMVCDAAARRLHAPGVGLAVAATDDLLQTLTCTPAAVDIEAAQVENGDGPALAAHRSGEPVLVPDLAVDERWHGLCGDGLAGEMVAAFSFPVRDGAVRLGTLNVYRDRAGGLDDDEHADALVFARLAFDLLLAPHDGVEGPPGGSAQATRWWRANGIPAPEVHQATGMVSVQFGIALADALAVLRAHAFAGSTPMAAVAAEVVARRLRFDPEP